MLMRPMVLIVFYLEEANSLDIPSTVLFPLEKELSYQNEVKIKANLRKDCYIFALTIGYR